jgi:hypothetical protein
MRRGIATTNSEVPRFRKETPCQAESMNQEMTVKTDPRIGAINPPNKPNAAPRVFHVEEFPGNLKVVTNTNKLRLRI